MASPAAQQVSLAFVRVIEERPVSLALAERIGVTHQSPQAIVIKNGKPLWHDSHERITHEALQEAAAKA